MTEKCPAESVHRADYCLLLDSEGKSVDGNQENAVLVTGYTRFSGNTLTFYLQFFYI